MYGPIRGRAVCPESAASERVRESRCKSRASVPLKTSDQEKLGETTHVNKSSDLKMFLVHVKRNFSFIG